MDTRKSVSVEIRPYKRYHKYWAKVVRAGAALPKPDEVIGAASIKMPFLRTGEEELFCGDLLFEGEANHSHKQRGWTYWVHYVDEEGELITAKGGWADFKANLKAAAGYFDADLLKGSGDLAACVRFAHVQRLGGLEYLSALASAARTSTQP